MNLNIGMSMLGFEKFSVADILIHFCYPLLWTDKFLNFIRFKYGFQIYSKKCKLLYGKAELPGSDE